MDSKPRPTLLKRVMAKRCDLCLPCRYARRHPDSVVGRAIHWHGRWCPFWQAWQEVYGDEPAAGEPADGTT
ncbi:MAG: hypothetical protein JRI23_24465 [Deltaproteobacteria bacterium]|jgi:hypothetical protein|nr:hypothetical protein [Deltaproteobacteria bacterium]MBW2535160.1 hypothetical protein [Deltaproteobacteria bacterium]